MINSAQKRKTYLIVVEKYKQKNSLYEDFEPHYISRYLRLDNVTEEYKTAYMDALKEVFGESAVEINEVV